MKKHTSKKDKMSHIPRYEIYTLIKKSYIDLERIRQKLKMCSGECVDPDSCMLSIYKRCCKSRSWFYNLLFEFDSVRHLFIRRKIKFLIKEWDKLIQELHFTLPSRIHIT